MFEDIWLSHLHAMLAYEDVVINFYSEGIRVIHFSLYFQRRVPYLMFHTKILLRHVPDGDPVVISISMLLTRGSLYDDCPLSG